MKKLSVGIVLCLFILPSFTVGAFGHKGVRSLSSAKTVEAPKLVIREIAPVIKEEARVIRPVVRKKYVPTVKSKAVILSEIRTLLAEIKRLQKKLEDLFKQL